MENWTEIFSKLLQRKDLDATESYWIMDQIMQGPSEADEGAQSASNHSSQITIAAALALLAAKGESPEEVLGFANSMVDHATPLTVQGRKLDIVGTGGDRSMSVNISSMASIVIAATGIRVVKHGNRAATSKSGSADVLSELGVNLTISPEQVADVANSVGISFAFAQVFHPSMRFAAPIRKNLPTSTVFNILGPLTNPSNPEAVTIGAAKVSQARLLADVFAAKGVEGLVFCGHDELGNGIDELAATQHGELFEIRGGKVKETKFDPMSLRESCHLEPISISDLKGGEPAYNADVARKFLEGVGSNPNDTKQERAIYETVLLNAAAGIVSDGTLLPSSLTSPAFENLTERFIAAWKIAKDTVDSGLAKQKLDDWAKATA